MAEEQIIRKIPDGMSRRDFLKLSGATIGGLTVAGGLPQLISAKETFQFVDTEPEKWENAVCRYCGTGCGMDVGVADGRVVAIRGRKGYPVNDGDLCLKGMSLMYTVHSDERATDPYIRQEDGSFKKVSMDEALDAIAKKINDTVAEHGPDSVAFYAGAQLFTEELYVANKLFKGVIGTNNVEANARLCMASAVTGFLTTFGKDEPPSGYLDIEMSDCFFLIGSNLAEQHPVIFARLLKRKAVNPNFKLIVADPRFTPSAAHADLWLPFIPGQDMALLNAMTYVLFEEGHVDEEFVAKHCRIMEGGGPWGDAIDLSLAEFEEFIQEYSPEAVAERVGVPANKIRKAAKMFGEAKECMSFWTMGLNQRKWGTWVNNQVYNLHLLTGKICRPGSTALSMTGQPNACGGVREQGMLSHILPAHRGVKNPAHRKQMEEIWKVPEGSISPTPGPHTVAMFDQLPDKIKLIWIACSNPGQSLPHLNKVLPKLDDAFVIYQDIWPPTQVLPKAFGNVTGEYADIFMPSSFWIEKGGVFGNTERRSSLTERSIPPPKPGMLSDGEIFLEVAKRMGHEEIFTYKDMEEVWDEYRFASRGTDQDLWGADYAYLREHGSAQWPILDSEEGDSELRYVYPEDKYLKEKVDKGEITLPDDNIYFYGFPDGRARIFKRPAMDPEEMVDDEYPIYLTTGRVVHHWHTGTMTMRVPWLKDMVPEAFVEINIVDAEHLGVKNHDMVRLVSRRGEIELKAKIVDPEERHRKGVEERVSIPRPGTIFVPFFDAEKLINLVCVDAVDGMSKEPEYKICAVRMEKVI